jgi:glycosyltransferase 2 family protein
LKKYILKSIQFTVFLSLGLGLLYLAFRGIELDVLWKSLRQANYNWVLLSLVLAFFAHLSRAYRWRLLIEPLGYKPRLRTTFYAVMVGYLANFAFPRIGEITRCGTLNRTDKIPVDSLLGTVIIERAFDLIMGFVFLFALLITRFDLFGGFLSSNLIKPALHKANSSVQGNYLLLLIAFLFFAALVTIYFVFRERLAKINVLRKIKSLAKGVFTGMKTVYMMQKRWDFLLHTALIWTLYFFMTYLVFFSIPATSNLGWVDGVFILVVGTFGMVAPVQGGIGAYHWMVSLGLTLYSIPREDGLVFATLSHSSQSLFAVLLGALSLMILVTRGKKLKSLTR